MSHHNIPPPPQYPHNGNEVNDHMVKDNSVMENSVVYISDNSSPNYKCTSKNEYYQQNTNQILPNLISSMNSTYQNLPPKSPKSNYRHVINQNEYQTAKMNPLAFQFKATSVNNTNNQFDSSKPQVNPNYIQKNSNPQNNQWGLKSKEELERNNKPNYNGAPSPTVQQNSGSKTRSHPNLMNDYVNLSGADHLLSEIMGGLHRKTAQNIHNKPQPNNQIIKTPNSTSNVLFGQSTPEMFRTNSNNNNNNHNNSNNNTNTGSIYPLAFSTTCNNSPSINHPTSNITAPSSNNNINASFIPEYFNKDSENFNTESSRLVNLLLEENKRLRSKLRQSDTRVEVIDQLERKIHNLEVLFEELLTSQRRQRLLDLQLQQASLSNYLSRNVISNQDISNNTNNTAKNMMDTIVSTSNITDTSNNPVDSNDTNNLVGENLVTSTSKPISTSNNIHTVNSYNLIPSSPVVSPKLTIAAEGLGENPLCQSATNTPNFGGTKKISKNTSDNMTTVTNGDSNTTNTSVKSAQIVLDSRSISSNSNTNVINLVSNTSNASKTQIMVINDANRNGPVRTTDCNNIENYRPPNYNSGNNVMNYQYPIEGILSNTSTILTHSNNYQQTAYLPHYVTPNSYRSAKLHQQLIQQHQQQQLPISSPMMMVGQPNPLPINQNPASLPASPIFYQHNNHPHLLTHYNSRNHNRPTLNSNTGVAIPITTYYNNVQHNVASGNNNNLHELIQQ